MARLFLTTSLTRLRRNLRWIKLGLKKERSLSLPLRERNSRLLKPRSLSKPKRKPTKKKSTHLTLLSRPSVSVEFYTASSSIASSQERVTPKEPTLTSHPLLLPSNVRSCPSLKTATLIRKSSASVSPSSITLTSLEQLLVKAGVSNKVDDSGQTVGKRYARTDECGIPFAITVDFETLKDDTVTLRGLDSMKQIRLPIADLSALILSLSNANTTWQEAVSKYGLHE